MPRTNIRVARCEVAAEGGFIPLKLAVERGATGRAFPYNET